MKFFFPGEDSDQMSAAGQMETFLGVQGLEEVRASRIFILRQN